MENEMRYYLGIIKTSIDIEGFEPKFFITAVELDTGAIEIATNTAHIRQKIDYILEAYDDNMHLKTNTAISMKNLMVV